MWHKFVMLEESIEASKYDWVWYIDINALITNTTLKLEDIIYNSLQNSTEPDQIDYLLTKDWYEPFPFKSLSIN
jgi:mannan polymerase II complex MNN10 subunit